MGLDISYYSKIDFSKYLKRDDAEVYLYNKDMVFGQSDGIKTAATEDADKKEVMYVYCTNNRGLEKYLTIEKKYEVTDPHGFDEEFNQYTIVNDKGRESGYARSRFAEVGSQKWRDMQLKKII